VTALPLRSRRWPVRIAAPGSRAQHVTPSPVGSLQPSPGSPPPLPR